MVDQTTERTIIAAAPDACYAAAIDFERYPEWASDVKMARILSRDDDGRAVDVEFRAAAMGRSTTYTLRYFYGANPRRCLLYTSPSPRDGLLSRMPSSA